MTDEPRTFRDGLHELAGDVASTASAASRARDRAHRGIVRHRRNQRAAVAGLATVVLVAGVTAAFALGRDSRHSAPPAGETTSAPPATATTVPPATTVAPAPAPAPAPIAIAPWDRLPRADHFATQHFPWGRGLDQVAFSVPQGEGASGGPTAFTVDPSHDVTLLDHSNSRIVEHSGRSAPSIRHLNLPSPAVTAGVFDDEGAAITALPDTLVVFGPQNRQSTFPYAGPEITHLAFHGKTVYSVSQDGALEPLLHRVAPGTYATGGTLDEPSAVDASVSTDRHTVTLRVPSTGEQYDLRSADPIGGVAAAVRLPNGDIDFVLAPQTQHTDPDRASLYALGSVPEHGLARLAAVQASPGYLVNGPEWQINDTGIAVMQSNTRFGVDVSYVVPENVWPG